MLSISWLKTFKWAIPAGLATCISWGGSFVRAPFDADFITNPDAYVRLERIYQMIYTNGWFERALMRVSTADGQILHWSRPLDALMAIAMWPLTAFMEPKPALLMAAMGLSFATYLCAVMLIYWLMLRCFKVPPWAAGLAAFTFTLLLDMIAVFAGPSWPDHHALMTLLFILSLGLAMRMSHEGKSGWAFGVVQGLAIWISPESIVPLASLYGGLVIVWLREANRCVTIEGLKSAVAFVALVTFANAIEYGTSWPGYELDRLSAFSVLVALINCAFWFTVCFAPRATIPTGLRRGSLALGLALLAMVTVWVVVPGVASGPMANADPWFVQSWTNMFGDGFSQHIWDSWLLIGVALAVLAWLPERINLALLSPVLITTTILSGVDSGRWITYSEPLALFIVVLGLAYVWPTLSALGDSAKGIALRVGSLAAITIAPMLLSALAVLLSPDGLDYVRHGKEDKVTLKADACKVQEILPTLATQPKTRILAHANITPALLYLSHHDVTAVPIHPNANAVRDSVRVLLAEEDDVALKIVKDYDVGLILLCPFSHEAGAYGKAPDSLFSRTLRGAPPHWLSPIRTGPEGFQVYAVNY